MIPNQLQSYCDQALSAFQTGETSPKSLESIQEWLEIDGWDELIADLGDQAALKLERIACFHFSDSEMLDNIYLADDAITDSDRITWGRTCIKSVIDSGDEYELPSVHCYELTATNGASATLGCLIEVHGQGGPVCVWCGLWKSKEEFLQSFGDGDGLWLIPQMGDVPDEVILSLWQKKSEPKKRVKAGSRSKR